MKNKPVRKKFRGFTLVEVMTSLVIMTILIAVASGVIIVTFDIFARSAIKRAAQNNGNNVYNYIYDHLSYATSLEIDRTVDINIEGAKAVVPDKSEDRYKKFIANIGEEKFTDMENANSCEVNKYFEYINILPADPVGDFESDCMKLTRKDVNKEVFVYGKQDEEDSSKIVNTMNGCDCIISFDKYDTNTKPDTIGFSVKISRDDEVFYERKGSIPILNEELKDHISIKDNITNETGNINLFYTYIW
jgi:prepilin-type N-terminal cleavage/methylation domain-containing protein